jgi:hypothetical protein
MRIFDFNSKKTALAALLLFMILFSAQPAQAQDEEPALTFGLSKDFGYALGSTIQGTFSVRVDDPERYARATLFIDGEQVAVDNEAPFRIQFSTSNFSPGAHSISMTAITLDGQEVSSHALEVEILSADAARSQAIDIILPLLGVILAVMALGTLLPVLLGRRKSAFEIGSYGPAGGAVCPKCQLPFGRHYFSANILVGKVERCPHCSKWSIVRRASSADLEAAEARYKATLSQGITPADDQEAQLRRMIDESRYESNE